VADVIDNSPDTKRFIVNSAVNTEI